MRMRWRLTAELFSRKSLFVLHVRRLTGASLACLLATAAGCATETHTGNGALLGGLLGTGVGALVGEAVGSPGTGALIGAGVGAISGAAIGSEMDEMEARNRAQIAAQMSRPVNPGACTVGDVLAMSQAG